MSSDAAHTTKFRVSRLSQTAATPFDLRPNARMLEAMRDELGLEGLRKVTFKGTIATDGQDDWRLDGHLGATVIQPCVVSLAPVTTRIEEDVTRHFVKDYGQPDDPEMEMTDDETIETLGESIDLAAVMTEALMLALPLYPRADAAEFGDAQYAAPGTKPMTDEDARPFAGLAGLRDALGKSGDK